MTLGEDVYAELDRRLAPVDAARTAAYPGERPGRQPVHTCYVPADAVVPGLAAAWGAAALAALDEHGLPDLGYDAGLLAQVLPRVRAKLADEPVEDLRVDAEDGYRGRPEAEDGDVVRAAEAVAADLAAGTAPPSVGIRAKSLEGPTRRRGVRSLDLFLSSVRAKTAVVTLPKVTDVEQVRAFLPVLDALEDAHGVALDLELQVETPQAVLGADGAVTLARMVHAAGPRLTGLHHGTYDYSAALGIAAAHQSSDHPALDLAKQLMQVAVAGTGARAVDGSTNLLPVGPREQVHTGWRVHAGLVRRALERGLYQGWDLHPAQLVTRYVATYAFFRGALPAAAARLTAYVERADAGVLDEPATARALAGVVLRGLDCGAVDAAEVTAATGLDRPALDALAGRGAARPGSSA
ncbi:aldolase/citrate lyase family protein [Geodermatophilus aquaeductus]|uniref:Citrate lyase beta subunit n=1 Tax=Geodermatophilus aquaeductus TaxID=1564161 RepID=A0A521BQN1_9ACTN|nr:aldolase/citrate lyase family protein [Geodermatophilus aquaeductus]SMO49433.1 Citrate lyase beta subunit [Geodermatophilus aquaeductus]